jgi:bacteriophage exclusion system BrxA-like protein
LDRLRRENVFGKASRSRVKNILAIFRQRYLREKSVTNALAVLVNHHFSSASLDRLLYFHSAKADHLPHDIVTELLLPLKIRGIIDIEVTDVERAIARWGSEGKMTSPWGEYTVHRVTRGLLSTLRDFGVLAGAVNKRLAPTYLPVEAFAYITFYLKQRQPSGAKLIDLPDWKLFFLPPEGVERLLIEAYQQDLLEHHAAGTVTRLTFPSGVVIYGPVRNVQGLLNDTRIGTDAVIYPAWSERHCSPSGPDAMCAAPPDHMIGLRGP